MYCFEPVFDQRAEILILGTFPSVKSRQAGFYYAHPQNAFWRIIGDLFCGGGEDLRQAGIERKKQALIDNRIALWDVCNTCNIDGSADASIRNVVFNDIAGLIGKTNIKAIFFNGAKAEELFIRYKKEKDVSIELPCRRLRSTSPACAVRYEKKRAEWKAAIDKIIAEP